MAEPLLVLQRPPDSELDRTARVALLERLSDQFGGLPKIDPETTSVRVHDLSFLPQADLLVLANDTWRPTGALLCFVRHGEQIWWLNGTSPPIHDMNTKLDFVLTEGNVLEYTAFFCFFVRAEDGPFFIVDSLTNTYLPPDLTKKLEQVHRPPRLLGQDADGDWRVSANIIYSNTCFASDFIFHVSNGTAEMLHDHPLLVDLPNTIIAPLQVERIEPPPGPEAKADPQKRRRSWWSLQAFAGKRGRLH